MIKKILIGIVFITANLSQGLAATNKTSTSAAKPVKPIGTYVGLGTPLPSLLGVNAAYNFTNNLRGVVGYGEVEVTTSLAWDGSSFASKTTKATTYSAGADYLFTDWAVRPIAGLRVGYFDIEGDGEFSVQGFDESTFLAYASAGFDYIAQGGFYMGLGTHLAFVGESASNFYANMGYFF